MAQGLIGLRVLRGPDWKGGNADGGEGHLGTVVGVLGDGQVQVVWDNGEEQKYCAGPVGKFELRAFDTAPIGVCHNGSVCAACQERNIYGMAWSCRRCKDIVLCPLCYFMDKHEIMHEFERLDGSGNNGVIVGKRAGSVKFRAMGIFPGAKVVRGRDWIWANHDGERGNVGEVLGFETASPSSCRNMVRVKWPNGCSNSYRLGIEGRVDLKSVEVTSGTFFYRDHLPVVDTSGAQALPLAITSLKPSTSIQDAPITSSSVHLGLEINVGDKVAIQVDEDRLKQLQANYGGTSAGLFECIGNTGTVIKFADSGALCVKFKTLTYRLNPQALIKVPVLNEGNVVKIHSDEEVVKVLNKRVGWKPDMKVTCGRIGKIMKIDDDGDVAVAFGQLMFMYAPACCIPTSGILPESLIRRDSSSSQNVIRRQESNAGESNLHHDIMKMLGQMMFNSESGIQVEEGDDPDGEMRQLFQAINVDNVEVVTALCLANTALLRKCYKGITLLMVACHEGKTNIVKKLLDLGAPIDGQGEQGNTPLGLALEGKKESIALLLLQKGANPNILNNKKRSPAHIAAYNNMGSALRELIKKGADINIQDKFKDAPLHDAIEKDSQGAIDALTEAPGIDFTIRNVKGFNMLQLACLRGRAHAVAKILQRDKKHVNERYGEFSALQIAAANDHVDCAKLLIVQGGASVDLSGREGLNALHLACNEAFPRTVELLIHNGADVNKTTDDGNTPLHLAVGTRSTHLKKDLSKTTEENENRNRVRIACMLLGKGASLDAKNKNGAKPLECCAHEVIRKGCEQFISDNSEVLKKMRTNRNSSSTKNSSSTSSNSASGSSISQVEAAMMSLFNGVTLPCGRCSTCPSTIKIKPCGHKSLCRDCCLKVTECPLCEQYIEERIASEETGATDLCKQM